MNLLPIDANSDRRVVVENIAVAIDTPVGALHRGGVQTILPILITIRRSPDITMHLKLKRGLTAGVKPVGRRCTDAEPENKDRNHRDLRDRVKSNEKRIEGAIKKR